MKRMNYRQILRYFTIAGVFFGCYVSGSNAFAEETTAPDLLSWQQLQQKPELNKSVSIEAARQPLSALLIQASQQVGVELVLSKELAQANKLTIIRANEMPLFDFMAALARIYVAQWHEVSPKRYELGFQKSNEVDVTIAQLGAPLFYRYQDRVEPGRGEIMQARGALFDQIVGELGRQNLSNAGGAPVASLMEETRAQLRAEYEKEWAVFLLSNVKLDNRLLTSNFTIRVSSSQREAPAAIQTAELREKFRRASTMITLELLDKQKQRMSIQRPLRWELSYDQIYGQPEKAQQVE